MLLLFALAETIVSTAGQPSGTRARAQVRIERGTRVNEEQWRRTPDGGRREIRRTGPDGRQETIRIVEFQ